MRPSDTRTRQKKDKLQQARNARGKVWQDDLLDILCGIPKVWCRGWPIDYSGQPYDIEATIDGRSWGIECKHIAKGNLPFSAFRPNEVENLSRKEDAGGVAVVAVRRDVPASDVYFPWYYIRDRIESGERGSVKLEGLPTDILSVLEVVHLHQQLFLCASQRRSLHLSLRHLLRLLGAGCSRVRAFAGVLYGFQHPRRQGVQCIIRDHSSLTSTIFPFASITVFPGSVKQGCVQHL